VIATGFDDSPSASSSAQRGGAAHAAENRGGSIFGGSEAPRVEAEPLQEAAPAQPATPASEPRQERQSSFAAREGRAGQNSARGGCPSSSDQPPHPSHERT